jgi:hypothetical protein
MMPWAFQVASSLIARTLLQVELTTNWNWLQEMW